jgi:eukaryotic-like serine/threonine-protein kinase
MQVEADVLPQRYRDPVRLGHGAMGDVLLARDTVLDRDVAVKLLATRFAEDADVRARFTREGLAAARLSGEPGIVTVYDVGEWHGRPFIVMEYLSGGSLADYLARGVPTVAEALDWLEQAARALDAGHRHGIVHRDVKPANLLLDGGGRVHVADFGVASAGGLDSLTLTGTILGTAGYLSPEQARGERATPASDRYALAVVAWELVAGERPFARPTATAEAAAHVNAPPPSLCERRRDLPCRELDAVFARALAKDPAARPGSARELVAELRHALASGAQTTRIIPQAAAPAPLPAPARRPGRWLLVAGLLVAALVAGAALATTLGGGGDTTQQTTVRTLRITQRGTTVTTSVTVTTSAPSPTTSAPAPTTSAPPATTTSSLPPAGGSPTALVDQATADLQAGNYERAAAEAQSALDQLAGSGEAYEAYALYDLGASLANLGDCKDAEKALRASEKIQGHRSEIDAAKQLCHRRP